MDFKMLFRRKNRKVSRPQRPEYQNGNVQPRLPKTRERALTLHKPGQLGLLSKLPIELRCAIYDAVFGHRKVHVVFGYGLPEYPTKKKEPLEWRWWHCICIWEESANYHYSRVGWDICRERTWASREIFRSLEPPPKLEFAILLACRQLYSEAIDILYRTTTFKFETRQLLVSFSTLVLPQRFVFISAIEMDYKFVNLLGSVITAEDIQPYNDMWAMLAGMPNLRYLEIAIMAHQCPNPAPAGLKKLWLGPLKQLGKMDVFDILVPWSYVKHLSMEDRLDYSADSFRRQFSVDEGSNFSLRAFPDIIIAVLGFGS